MELERIELNEVIKTQKKTSHPHFLSFYLPSSDFTVIMKPRVIVEIKNITRDHGRGGREQNSRIQVI